LLKQIIAFVFLSAFSAQSFSRAFVVFDYFANTKTYAKNCENKARPKMHCNGKCQMMKKLKQEEKKEAQNPERKAENKDDLVLSSRSFYPSLNFDISLQKIHFPMITTGKEIKIPRSLLRPPIC
jgi:hypothetical protein